MIVGIKLQLLLLISITNEVYSAGIVAPRGYLSGGAPKDGCGSPQWKGDDFCDDDNNNARCDFDGGDCCGNKVQTEFCDICKCLEEEAPPGNMMMASENCKDANESCPQWKHVCDDNSWVYENCAKTCENKKKCGGATGDAIKAPSMCYDQKRFKPDDYCEKNKKYCGDGNDFGQMFWHCRETCGRCGDLPPCKIVSIKSKLGSGYYEWSSFCDCVEDDQCGNLLKIGYLKCDQGYTAEECPFSCGKC